MRQLPQDARRAIAAGYSPSFVRAALEETEREWLQAEAERRRATGPELAEQLAGVIADRAARPVSPDESDRDIRELARRRAALMLERITALPVAVGWEWLDAQVRSLEARGLPPFDDSDDAPTEAEQLAGMVKRATAEHWWRKQLRRVATSRREAAAHAAGAIGAHRRTPYVTNETARRYVVQQQRNRESIERTVIESADGEQMTLAKAADTSTANKAIRRAEFMTRLRGCEEWGEASGMAGDFATLTTPSRFHPARTKRGGIPAGRNPRWNGSTPKQGQQWLCHRFALVRAKLHREGLGIFGFRIAEPHGDGAPHWHALWWGKAEQLARVRAIVFAYWLQDDVDQAGKLRARYLCQGQREARAGRALSLLPPRSAFADIEDGAIEHRVGFEAIEKDKGGACAYLAKYVAKNIDDAGAVGFEGHTDERDGAQMRLEGIEGALRATAWASAHGIRQFQAIGQPPVGAWREARRLPQGITAEESRPLQECIAAVNRDGIKRADWSRYMSAQGGAMQSRRDYLIRLAKVREQREGVYGLTVADRPVGLQVAGVSGIYRSQRKQWKPRGTWASQQERDIAAHGELGALVLAYNRAATPLMRLPGWGESARPQAARPWTRVNNCTQHPDQLRPLGALPGKESRRPAPRGWPDDGNEAPGGDLPKETAPCEPPPPLPPPPAITWTKRTLPSSLRSWWSSPS